MTRLAQEAVDRYLEGFGGAAATSLARGLGAVLGRIRYRGETFLVERNGVLVARIGPVASARRPRLRELFDAWTSVEADPQFADDLEAIGAADTPARHPSA